MSNDGKLKILVTGGGGFIGSFLVQQLSRKHKIIILDHGNRYKILKKKIKKNVEFVIGDVTDEKILDRILKKNIDVIIHLAGVLGNNACMNDPVNAVISHVNGTHVLIKKSKHYHVKRFIFASSQAVYSTFKVRKSNLNEKMKLEADDLYGVLKGIAENEIMESGINYTILRFANVYGFNQSFNQQGGAIMNFMNALTKKSKMSIFGSGKQKIDYIELVDISDCIKIILNNSKLKNETFNVGSGKLTSIIEIAKIISNIGQKHFGYSTKITKIPAPDRKIWPDRLMSINKIKKITGWKPKVSLKQGIEKLIENEVGK